MLLSKKNKGFTLLEIMVVIVILGLLMSIVVPNLMGNKETADIQKAVTDINGFETNLDMYKLNNNRYPTTEQGLQALVEKPSVDPVPRRYPDGGYIRRLPDDPWGNAYLYQSPGEHGKFDVYSMGPDMEANTEDDIGNWNLTDYQN